MTIIGARKITYIISGTLSLLSILSLFVWGLKPGIDFTGGSLMEIEYKNARPANNQILDALRSTGILNATVQPSGEKADILRFRDIDEKTHQDILESLKKLGDLDQKQFNSIGPTIGNELKKNSAWAIAIVLIMIVAYISWAFRKVSRPISSWKYGVAAIIALIHDVSIPVGVFSVLGHFYGVEVDTLFVTALLTILGFSVHDTIVVFDRIRENLNKLGSRENFESIVEKSIRNTITRSINTSLTVLLVMSALYLFGGASTKFFSLALLIGVFCGTYSSIFIASALLVTSYKMSIKRS